MSVWRIDGVVVIDGGVGAQWVGYDRCDERRGGRRRREGGGEGREEEETDGPSSSWRVGRHGLFGVYRIDSNLCVVCLFV